jgi:hypothetical protein
MKNSRPARAARCPTGLGRGQALAQTCLLLAEVVSDAHGPETDPNVTTHSHLRSLSEPLAWAKARIGRQTGRPHDAIVLFVSSLSCRLQLYCRA